MGKMGSFEGSWRRCGIVVLVATVALLVWVPFAVAVPGGAGDHPQPNKVKAQGPVPADLAAAAARGNAAALAAQKYWEEGGEVIALSDGSYAIPSGETQTGGASAISTESSISVTAATPSFLGSGVWLVNPLQGMMGVQAVADVAAFSTEGVGARWASVALVNYTYSRTFTWSFIPALFSDSSLDELRLKVYFWPDGATEETYTIVGTDGSDERPVYLKIAKSTAYPMAPEAWNIYFGRDPSQVEGIKYDLYWFTSKGTGTATALDAAEAVCAGGHFTNILFLNSKMKWVQQTLKNARNTYVYEGTSGLDWVINKPYYDWAVVS